MSIHAIKQYQSEVEKIIHFGGTKKETAIRNAFYNLLNDYAKGKGLMLVPEVTIKAPSGKNVTPDGTLKDSLRQDWGYWESKDEADIIDDEINKKFAKGYPKDNILFEDSITAVLIQNGIEAMRVSVSNAEALDRLILAFINFERPEVTNFRKAIELFKQDIPKVTETIRGILEAQEKTNPKFVKERDKFLKLCHDSINPDVTKADVREMIIQHILTEDIFNTIFDETQFHRENNIAHQLEGVINTFFTGNTKKITLSTLQHYSKAINAAAAGIADHHEKQKFLKVVYETFYKSYNPKAADRLGVVYTPNEIVKFMIESTDYLLNKHFGKFLEDKGVDILDPATGTGTFICDIIDYIRKEKLEYKYKNELHANEVAILPYYISNLNIEFTYTQKMKAYSEFENLCFVDTLDNLGFGYKDKQIGMFAPFTEENSKRIKKQNDKKIAVVIGNPPYNAAQQNYNDNNANRYYKEIDKRIKDTFIKYGQAQNQIAVYDMYVRFLRWAMDRIDENGVIAFVSNNSFVDSTTLDGLRKVIGDDFNHCYIINLKGNARTSGERRRQEGGNVFHDQIRVGIAIYFFVRKKGETGFNVYYDEVKDYAKADQKLTFITERKLKDIPFENIRPDKNNNWINQTDNDFETLIPLINKDVKAGKSKEALFKYFSRGLETNRQDWVYDYNTTTLSNKVKLLTTIYENQRKKQSTNLDLGIKWSRDLKQYLDRDIPISFSNSEIKFGLIKPFIKQFVYLNKYLNGYIYEWDTFEKSKNNKLISFASTGNLPFHLIASKYIVDLHFTGDSQCIPFYNNSNESNSENVTDWGVNQFIKQYGKKGITKETIFSYVYAVLHNPAYRKKYELNLKRELPRIPFYTDFKKWSDWGKTLMDLHIDYETVKLFGLKNITDKTITNPKCKLKADKENGTIILDEATTLIGIPKEAWEYKLGNRSALEWVLDQHKEKKPSDPTIAEKFNTYKFSDYKDQVIDLLKRVCTVSVETMKIIKEMEKESK